eukprot:4813645-Amphidinium_carterae.1
MASADTMPAGCSTKGLDQGIQTTAGGNAHGVEGVDQDQAIDYDRQLHNYIKKVHVRDADPLDNGLPVTGPQGLQQ